MKVRIGLRLHDGSTGVWETEARDGYTLKDIAEGVIEQAVKETGHPPTALLFGLPGEKQ